MSGPGLIVLGRPLDDQLDRPPGAVASHPLPTLVNRCPAQALAGRPAASRPRFQAGGRVVPSPTGKARGAAPAEGAAMADRVRILVVGVGNMGASHAKAYHKLSGFEVCGLMSRALKRRTDLPAELEGYPRFQDFEQALAETRRHAVSINTWPNTHADYALRAMDAGCHVFMEKPIATTYEDAVRVVDKAKEKKQKTGARLHPAPPPVLGQAGRDRAHARQAAGHAHEPQPAVLGPGLELAQEPDGEPDPDRRLRGPLRRHHVPADRGETGARARHRRPGSPPRPGFRTTAICTSCSTTARSAGTRPAGGR